MSLFLGFDTSNYTTSVALYDPDTGRMYSARKLLPVEQGALGLRQRDALFLHTVQLSALVASLAEPLRTQSVAAAAASERPREAEDSYMPCFLAGKSHAETSASLLNIPYYAFSHQQGHIAAGVWSAKRTDLLSRDFLALHVSGGTTDLLYVTPAERGIIHAEQIGGTADLAAGQLVDRCGRMLGLPFPAGPALEALALGHTSEKSFTPKTDGLRFSVSGLENKVQALQQGGESPANIAYFALRSIAELLSIVLDRAKIRYPDRPILCAGGVMANAMIRSTLESRFGAVFAKQEYSSDNAAGIAFLAAETYRKGEVPLAEG